MRITVRESLARLIARVLPTHRIRAPRFLPPVLVWGSTALAISAALLAMVYGVQAALWTATLPWWAVLLVYSAPAGAALRLQASTRSGWEQAWHRWLIYRRWAASLSEGNPANDHA